MLDEAEGWYKQSLGIFKALGDQPGLAKIYHSLGLVAEERGRLDAAEGWYKQSLSITEALGNQPGMASSQALDRTQPGLPMKRGRGATMTHDYKRH